MNLKNETETAVTGFLLARGDKAMLVIRMYSFIVVFVDKDAKCPSVYNEQVLIWMSSVLL